MEPCIQWRSRFLYRMGNFGELFGPLKSIGSLCCGVCSKSDHSVVNNYMTARLLQPTAMLLTSRCHITLSPWKKFTPWCGLLSKLVDHSLLFLLLNILRNAPAVRPRSYVTESSCGSRCRWARSHSRRRTVSTWHNRTLNRPRIHPTTSDPSLPKSRRRCPVTVEYPRVEV